MSSAGSGWQLTKPLPSHMPNLLAGDLGALTHVVIFTCDGGILP